MEAARRLKANLKLEGQPCGWCETGLQVGDDAAVCSACEKPHHGACWDGKAGCATAGCVNAPLRRLDTPPAPGAVPAVPFAAGAAAGGGVVCPACRTPISATMMICPMCRAITSPDGIYHGPMTNAPGAVASLVAGIIGLFVCGIILGPYAISKANAAKLAISGDPTLTGGGLATAGYVMGIIDIVAWGIVLLARLGGGM